MLLLDHAAEPGAKILISGGGRCNFTNTGTAPERFLSDNPRFARSALDRYTPDDFIALVRRHDIAFHEKTKGQLFCDGSARGIVAMLLQDAQAVGVDLRLGDGGDVMEIGGAEFGALRGLDHAAVAHESDALGAEAGCGLAANRAA